MLAKVRPFRRRAATSLPWILIILALAAPDRARADDTPWVDVRHQVGFQAGGSGFFQMVYRYRFLGPVSVDVGGMGAPPDAVLANVSLGLVAAFRNRTRFVPYVGSGLGFAVDAGPAKGCDQSTNTDCPTVGDALLFGYGRAGVGLAVDAARRHTISLDVGFWYGRRDSSSSDGTSMVTTRTRFLWPMAGLSYLVTFRP